MDNRGGMLRYKCRMCGEEYERLHVPDVGTAIAGAILNFNPWPSIPPMLLDQHYHKDGTGVADLIGGVVDSPAHPAGESE